MIAEKTYVRTDENGAMRVGNSRVSLDSVVIGFQQGEAPETIQRSFPSLTLEEVYGAITYYLAHRAEVDAYLEQQEQLWDRLVAEQERNPTPAMQRLFALRTKLEEVAGLRGEPYAAALAIFKREQTARAAAGEISTEQANGLIRLLEMMHLSRDYRRPSGAGAPGA